jgi:hypothetical protein
MIVDDEAGEGGEGLDSAPVWMAVGDLMAGMLGLFVMFLLWTLVLQADMAADLEAEKQARTEVTQRLDTLEQVVCATHVNSGYGCLPDVISASTQCP